MLLLHRKILNLHKIHKTKKILGLDIKRKYDQQENFEYNESNVNIKNIRFLFQYISASIIFKNKT
jgi:hypothetical protein